MKRAIEKRLSTSGPELASVEAVLVSVDGKTRVSLYRNRLPDETEHVFSVTKSVLAILVGLAVDEGRLRLDQTLGELLPGHRSQLSDQLAGITLRQLLTMTAGFPEGTEGFTLEGDDPVGLMLSYGLLNEPGVAFEYSNTSAHLVSAILAQATGQTPLAYARAKLFDPLGIDSSPAYEGPTDEEGEFDKAGFAWSADSRGINCGALGLKLTADDMLKLGQLYLDQGRWQGRQIVSAAWVAESTSQQLSDEQASANGNQYGYFWWVGEIGGGHRFFAASGSYSQLILVVPDLGLVTVVSPRATGPYEDQIDLGDLVDRDIVGRLT